jgi:hypothetical protein
MRWDTGQNRDDRAARGEQESDVTRAQPQRSSLQNNAGKLGVEHDCHRYISMMSLPFFGVFLAALSAWLGYRKLALALTLASIAGTLALFRMHATDALQIAL